VIVNPGQHQPLVGRRPEGAGARWGFTAILSVRRMPVGDHSVFRRFRYFTIKTVMSESIPASSSVM